MQFSLYATLVFAATLFTVWLAYAIWSRRPGVGVIPYMIMALGTVVWTFGSALEHTFVSYADKAFAAQIIYIGVVLIPPAWMIFALEYTGNDKWITRGRLLLLVIEPLIVHGLIATNDNHHLFWASRWLTTVDGMSVMKYTYASGFWIHATYSYLLLLVGAVLLIRAMIRSPKLYRGQVLFLLVATFTPWLANAVTITGISPLPSYVDLTALAFTVAVGAVAWSLYRFRLMDIVPVARETIIDNMDDALLVIDRDERVLDINQAAINLLPPMAADSRLIGRGLNEILPADVGVLNQFRDLPEVDSDITLTIRGRTRAFNLRITPLRNRQKELTGRIVVLHDITSLKETNAQLESARAKADEANRMKSEFLATMSHELRTPLNAIIGFSEIQLMGMVGELNDTQREYQGRVLANAQQLLELINNILDLSKIEAGHVEVINAPFAMRAWLDEIIQQNAVLAQGKGLEFTWEIDPRLPDRVVGDASLLRRVVVNLVVNAIKFTKAGKVHLSLGRHEADTWRITVTDTGIGIPPDKLSSIFAEFYQVDSSLTREYGGTGLGLAIVRRLATKMNGTIDVSSTVDEGSTFTVTLPLVEHQVAPPTAIAEGS